jgi:hypothetical protein
LREKHGVIWPVLSRDQFVVKYEVAPGTQSSLDYHQDGDIHTMMSYNILLNPASDFTGGGTTFRLFNRAALGIEQGAGLRAHLCSR